MKNVKSVRLVDKVDQTVLLCRGVKSKTLTVSHVYLKDEVMTGVVRVDGAKIKVKALQSSTCWSQVA